MHNQGEIKAHVDSMGQALETEVAKQQAELRNKVENTPKVLAAIDTEIAKQQAIMSQSIFK